MTQIKKNNQKKGANVEAVNASESVKNLLNANLEKLKERIKNQNFDEIFVNFDEFLTNFRLFQIFKKPKKT